MIRPFALERYFAKHEFSARYLLGSSDPEAMSLEQLLALEPGSDEMLKQLWLGYTESLGDPALRKDIAQLYQNVNSEQIMVFSGAQEPIYAFMQVALNSGDHIIVHFPGYQSHYSVAQSRNIEVSFWQANPKLGWAPDIQELQRLLKPNTKALLICTPHNPTGYQFSEIDFHNIVSFARQHGLILFCDEVYRGSEHNVQDRLPNMADLYENAISLNCLSKNCGLAGLRIGWIATRNKRLYDQLASFKDYLTICNSAPSEFLAGVALRNLTTILAQQRKRLVGNLDLLENFFARYAELFDWHRPKAGTTTFPRFLNGDALEFCDKLVAEAGILLIPGNFFDMPQNFIRFGYGRENFAIALAKLEKYLDTRFVF